MITLSTCLIWQIINFILLPNEYGCVCAWTKLGNIATDRLQKKPIMAKKIIFSDETHFNLGGYVNKQNCSIWGTETPLAYIEKPTHIKRVTVWCGFWFRSIIWPFFFENKNLTSTGRRYLPHSRSYPWCFAPCFWRSHFQPQSWCRSATSEVRFDSFGLLFVGCRQR